MQLRCKVIQFHVMSTQADTPFRNLTILKQGKRLTVSMATKKSTDQKPCWQETVYRIHFHTRTLQYVLTEHNLIVCHFSQGSGLTDCFIISRMHVCKLASQNAFVNGRKSHLMPQFIYRAVMRISYGKKLPPFIWWLTVTMPRN